MSSQPTKPSFINNCIQCSDATTNLGLKTTNQLIVFGCRPLAEVQPLKSKLVIFFFVFFPFFSSPSPNFYLNLAFFSYLSIGIAQHQHQYCLALAFLSIRIAQHQNCLALALLSISIAQHQNCLALALLSVSIALHQHCLALG